jgi:hypothetical protein
MLTPFIAVVGSTYLFGTWLAGVSVAAILLVWKLLRTNDGPSVLALALTFQWVQVTVGIFYHAVTGAELSAIYDSDYQTMVLLGLGCVTSLALGLWGGIRMMSAAHHAPPDDARESSIPWHTLLIVYVGAIAATATIQELAWRFPALTQAILAMTFSRLAVLFLMLRRLVSPVFEWKWVVALLTTEVVLGFTGYFAGFREPIIMAAIATLEVFDRRNARHWAAAGMIALALAVTSVVWMGVRVEFRHDFESDIFAESRSARLTRMRALTSEWLLRDAEELKENVTELVDRVWAIYYPALAVKRVPAALPHTDGSILAGALTHLVTPRLLFPDKPELPSDSEMVRKYSGVWVASVEQNTSIAFGYAAESYVDFGLPWMFLPVAIYGVAMGIAYVWFKQTIRHRELAIPLVCVMFWLALYLFERSWIKTLGLSVTLMVYLGGACFLLDRYLTARAIKAAEFEDQQALTTQLGSGHGS